MGEVPAKAGRAQLYRREKAPADVCVHGGLRAGCTAKLEKEVVVAGIFNRVEIWNAQRWAKLEEEAFSSGSLEQAMEEMGL